MRQTYRPHLVASRINRKVLRVSDSKHSCIAAYLTENFPGAKVEQKHDFSLRAQSFKVFLAGDNLLLTVNDEFVGDHDEQRIAALLIQWGVAALLKANSNQAVLITTDGAQVILRP